VADKQKQGALNAKADAEAQKREAIAARDKLEAKNRELRSLLEEAAQSDWLVAKEKLIAGEAPAALAHLARAISYEPISTLAPETAVAALNDWRFPLPLATLRGHEGALFGAQFSPKWGAYCNRLLRQHRTALGYRHRKVAGHSPGPRRARLQRAVQPPMGSGS
jgi:hypothetical protein